MPDGVSVLLLRLLPACVRIAGACVRGQARAHSPEAKVGEAREGGKRVADRDSSARPQLVDAGAEGERERERERERKRLRERENEKERERAIMFMMHKQSCV